MFLSRYCRGWVETLGKEYFYKETLSLYILPTFTRQKKSSTLQVDEEVKVLLRFRLLGFMYRMFVSTKEKPLSVIYC